MAALLNPDPVALVSAHGGHSGQFCSHAVDSLEDIVERYVERGFSWVGLTEHMPAMDDTFVPSEEREAGLNAHDTRARFAEYVRTARVLQQRYANTIDILVAFEVEVYTGNDLFIRELIDEFRPDYIVGSVHHIFDIPFDAGSEHYENAIRGAGGFEEMYCRYFDDQFAMIEAFRPAVVGHFDLVRILDSDYANHLSLDTVGERIERNLQAIADHGLQLDLNVRAIAKGQPEPYPTRAILERARELGVRAVIGDDSHGVDSVGRDMAQGIRVARELGFDMNWKRPASPG
jgi:histidinol-phosphatase (PHP family)